MPTISKIESKRYTLEDFGDFIVLRSKFAPSVALSFRHWDDVDEVYKLLGRALGGWTVKEGKENKNE